MRPGFFAVSRFAGSCFIFCNRLASRLVDRGYVISCVVDGLKPEHEPKILKLTSYWQLHWPRWLLKNKRWLSVVVIIFIMGGIWQLTPRDDVRLLQSAPVELIKDG